MSQLPGGVIPVGGDPDAPGGAPGIPGGFEDGLYGAIIDAVRQNGAINNSVAHALASEITYDWHPWINQRISFSVVANSVLGVPSNTRAASAPFHIVPAKANDPCTMLIQAGVIKLIVNEGVYGEACP